MTAQVTVEDKLQALKQKYYQSLPDKLDDIQSSWQQCKEQKAFTDKVLESSLHKLAGSAGMYDEEELGQIARDAELLIANCDDVIDDEVSVKISDSLKQLSRKIEQLSQETSA